MHLKEFRAILLTAMLIACSLYLLLTMYRDIGVEWMWQKLRDSYSFSAYTDKGTDSARPTTEKLPVVRASPAVVKETEELLLVIFTTFKEDSNHHKFAHRLAILNWASHGPSIKPVLFSDQAPSNVSDLPNLTHFALMNGWDVLPVPSRSRHGTPHLKAMYSVVFGRYKSMFYGYSNGDLLFDGSLPETMTHVGSRLRAQLADNVLAVGKRTDVFLRVSPSVLDATRPEDVSRYAEQFNASGLRTHAKSGTVRASNAIDYFFFSRGGSTFDWGATADVVIGRRAYDQYLVAKALDFKVTTVDATKTLLAVHLSKPGVWDTGLQNRDKEYNYNLVGKDFLYARGSTDATRLLTAYEAQTFKILLAFR